MKLNLNFLGGGRVQNKKPSVGGVWVFLELHIELDVVCIGGSCRGLKYHCKCNDVAFEKFPHVQASSSSIPKKKI